MARLKVGDIEIDGATVRIAGATTGTNLARDARTAYTAQPAPPPGTTLPFLKHVPFPARTLIWAGAIVAAAGVVIGVLGLTVQESLLSVLLGAALLSLGGGTAVLGALKVWNREGFPGYQPGFADPATDEYVAQLRRAISSTDTRNTVEVIANKLGWSERDVVRTLGWLQARGELREELDVDSGDFYYVSVKVPRDLATRLSST